MAKQLLNSWKRHRRAVQSVGSRIKKCFGKRMAQIVMAERGSEFCCLTKLGNDLTNATFGQRSTLTEKEMSIWSATRGRNHFSLDCCPLSPAFSQVFALGEIGIERLACFLDQRDLAMFGSFAPSHDEQAAPS